MSVIDEIKERLDIVDVVSDYAALKKTGRNFKALCPFHTEKSPSFFVFPERGTWHCFGSCGTGGDVFSFVMRKEGIEFGEALKLLADRAGVKLVSRQTERAADKTAEMLHEINQAAAQYYHNLLLNDKAGAAALNYLNERGISRETITNFELGLSPDSWDSLFNHLIGKGYQADELVKAGLAVKREDGGFHDMFRNRLMIPIRNEAGKVAGFGARALDDTQPKYINSPQTPVFDKSGMLYGLDRAKPAIRERGLAIIVEGYLDVLTAHQHGFTNVVAPMGTSLTEKQTGVLKRLTHNLVLAMDADAAGERATLRDIGEIKKALSERIDHRTRGWLEGDYKFQGSLNIIPIPQGKDPDEVIKENPDDWNRLVQNAQPVMDYLLESITLKLDLNKESDRKMAIDQLAQIVAELISDAAEKEIFLRKASKKIGVAERIIADKAAQLKPTVREKLRQPVELPVSKMGSHPLEEYCLALLLQNPWLHDGALALSPEHFEGTENREIFTAWIDNPDADKLGQSLDSSLQEHLDALVHKALPPASQRELEIALADCTRRLWEHRLRKLKAMEEMLLLEAESEGDKNSIQEQAETLLSKGLEPTSQLRELFENAKRERRGVRR